MARFRPGRNGGETANVPLKLKQGKNGGEFYVGWLEVGPGKLLKIVAKPELQQDRQTGAPIMFVSVDKKVAQNGNGGFRQQAQQYNNRTW